MSLAWLRPALVVEVLLVLVAGQLLYALFPYRQRAFLPILAATAAGFALGLGWDALGLPSLRIGEAPVLPGALFAAAGQLLVDRRPQHPRADVTAPLPPGGPPPPA